MSIIMDICAQMLQTQMLQNSAQSTVWFVKCLNSVAKNVKYMLVFFQVYGFVGSRSKEKNPSLLPLFFLV